MTIQGSGSLNATKNDLAAGIGGGEGFDCGNIIINSGNITTTGGSRNAAIGGAKGCACGNITIAGGTVNVTEGIVGIGAASSGTCGDITITGGTVVVSKGTVGIGTADNGTCSNITITGGSINVTERAVGIGASSNGTCGDITITGGVVGAQGESDAVGIGAGHFGKCGNITITGGVVVAKGGKSGVGIGTGVKGTCGNIIITRTVTSVTASTRNWEGYSIGTGKGGVCGNIIIGGLYGAIGDSYFTYAPTGENSTTVHFDANGGNGTMSDWLFTYDGTWKNLPANTFTALDNSVFAGWNTQADGSGYHYKDEAQIIDIPYETLYAQWKTPLVTITDATKELTLYDHQTVTGTGGPYTHITIANGATVTLNNLTFPISRKYDLGDCITCEGDATIILEGENTAWGNKYVAAIFVPWNRTLTFQGSGKLFANSLIHSAGIGCGEKKICGNIIIKGGDITTDGIGSGEQGFCGNITITGGTINANMIGIGSGCKESTCGNITITGGDITTTSIGSKTKGTCGDITISGGTIIAGTNSSPVGIGSGTSSTCGNITISGGDITATSGSSSAGIGSGKSSTCGDITISGGNITATSGSSGVGIGSVYGDSYKVGICGNITINGGTVNATGYTGIGTFGNGKCGDITITHEVTSVTATTTGKPTSNLVYHSIGRGKSGTCGTITLSGNIVEPILKTTFTYIPTNSSTIHFDGNGAEGTMADIAFTYDGNLHQLPTNGFVDSNRVFSEWNTKADGSGTAYCNKYQYLELPDVTLYAQWRMLTESITKDTKEITFLDGQTVTGKGGSRTKIFIAEGATVTFRDVEHTRTYKYAGITCLGDATLIFEGDNKIYGYDKYPSIWVPEGKTLTIKGSGSVFCRSDELAAGIGSGDGINCGNIIIEGGTIKTQASMFAAGIGSGRSSTCGNITIKNTITSVSITKYQRDVSNCIGIGRNGICGTITIEDGLIDEETKKERIIAPTPPVSGEVTLTENTGYVTLENGAIVSGTGGANTHICIADGAIVTLNDVDITAIADDESHQWAGITCMGNATIILEGTNKVKGGHSAQGIYVPSDKELIIDGNGSLLATGNGEAAGIGGESNTTCTIDIMENITLVSATNGIMAGTLNLTEGMVDLTVGNTRTITNLQWTGSGTEQDPYIISTPKQLSLLAERVNSGLGGYAEKYYKLGADIAYDPDELTIDYNGDGIDDSNFESIGYYDDNDNSTAFCGHFDGDGHTISGIRITKMGPGGEGDGSDYQGLFGWIGYKDDYCGVVENVTLRDAEITGCAAVGGIVGCLTRFCTVRNCYVGNDVTIHAVSTYANDHGGIAGYVAGTVEKCISAAIVSKGSWASHCHNFGGIAGDNNGGTLSRNLVLGADINTTSNATYGDTYGVIVGHSNSYSDFTSNYYSGCNIDDAGGIGDYVDSNYEHTYLKDLTTYDGALDGLRDGGNNTNALNTLATIFPATLDLGWGTGKHPVNLTGRTLYKDGAWNTLCLPFDVTDSDEDDGISFTGTPLENAIVMELDGTTSNIDDNGTLTLNFTSVTEIEAGKPYIVKWEKDEYYDYYPEAFDIVNPVFNGVSININASREVNFTGGKFVGTYDPVDFTANDKSKLFLGGANKLHWPSTDLTLNACRAYFELDNNVQASRFVLNFDGEGETTSIIEHSTFSQGECGDARNIEHSNDVIYDLQGHKVTNPTKGLYIVNGNKIVIK